MSRTSARRMEERRDLTFALVRTVRVGMAVVCRKRVEVSEGETFVLKTTTWKDFTEIGRLRRTLSPRPDCLPAEAACYSLLTPNSDLTEL